MRFLGGGSSEQPPCAYLLDLSGCNDATGGGMAVLLTSLTPMGAMFQSQYTMFTSTTNPDTRGYG
jgi:hypothetical protein